MGHRIAAGARATEGVLLIEGRGRQEETSGRGRWQLRERRGTADGLRCARRNSIGSTNRGRSLGNLGAQLSGDGDSGEMVAADELGMPQDESRGQCEGDQENEGDGRQTAIGHEFTLPGSVDLFGTVTAGM